MSDELIALHQFFLPVSLVDLDEDELAKAHLERQHDLKAGWLHKKELSLVDVLGADGEPARAGGGGGASGGGARAGRPSERAGDRPHRLRAGKILWCALGCDHRYGVYVLTGARGRARRAKAPRR